MNLQKTPLVKKIFIPVLALIVIITGYCANFAANAATDITLINIYNHSGSDKGRIFLTPSYLGDANTDSRNKTSFLKVVDKAGHLIKKLTLPKGKTGADFKVQKFLGQPVFTWWEGLADVGYSVDGTYFISDENFNVLRVIQPPAGTTGDLHEFKILPDNTFAFTTYKKTKVHGKEIIDSGFIIYDLFFNRILFQWNASQHVSLSETEAEKAKQEDFFHINSVNLTPDGNYIISSRHTSALYKIDRNTGKVIWRLGGKKSNFKIYGGNFRFQHDAQFISKDVITIFDNHSASIQDHGPSGIVYIKIDEKKHIANIYKRFTHPNKIVAWAMGNAEYLPNGNIFSGWGTAGRIMEFNSKGQLIYDAKLASGLTSYRAFYYTYIAKTFDPARILNFNSSLPKPETKPAPKPAPTTKPQENKNKPAVPNNKDGSFVSPPGQ